MNPVLEVEELSYTRAGLVVLDGITFTLAATDSIGIAGPNGAGKSTLIWCILGLLKSQGVVTKPVRTGVVFQNPEDQLFMPTLLDDLMLPLRSTGMAEAQASQSAIETLQRFELAPLASRPASELSLGQRKRAALALAMVSRPSLLLLDEPTSELDPRSCRLLADALVAAPAARLVASHDLRFIERTCSRLVILNHGRIQADGPTASILADTALLDMHGLR